MPGHEFPRRTALLLAVAVACAPAVGAQVVVLSASAHEEGDRAGVRAGDRILGWTTTDGGTAAMAAAGSLDHPFEFERLRLEHGTRVAVILHLEREDATLGLALDPGTWGIEVRPLLEGEDLLRFETGWSAIRAAGEEQVRAALATWKEVADDWREAAPELSVWLDLRRAEAARKWKWLPEAESAIADALALAELAGEQRWTALALEARGFALERASSFEAAQQAFASALELRRELDPGSLTLARAIENVGRIAWWRDRLDEAQQLGEEALALRRAIAPDGLPVAESYNELGNVAWNRGDLGTCESYHRRALDIRRRLSPVGLKTAYSLVNLGIVQWKVGSLSEAEASYREAIELYERLRPDGIEMARARQNLGIVHMARGRLVDAEAVFLRNLEVMERAGTQRDLAHALTTLGELAELRRDEVLGATVLQRAFEIKRSLGLNVDSVPTLFGLARITADPAERERWLLTARDILEAESPDSYQLAEARLQLSLVAREQGRRADADELLGASLELAERTLPTSRFTAEILRQVARVELEDGHPALAEERLRHALDLVLADMPGTAEEALARHALATALRARGAVEAAHVQFAAAERTLEANLADREGTGEERARHRASWADLYLDHIALLVDAGRIDEAFGVAERYRGRELAALLAARDLGFREVSPELVRRQQLAETRYRRLLAASRAQPASLTDATREALLVSRRELVEVEQEIARTAPRVAGLHQIPAVDLAGARRLLDRGDLLLSYVVAADRTWLFALGPGGRELSVHVLPTARTALDGQIRGLRDELARPSLRSAWRLRAGALAEQLVGPVVDRLLAAERVVVLPDGPLHFLPFAALPAPGPGGERLLVELRPTFSAASLTVLGELAREPLPRPLRLVAFADPDYRPSSAHRASVAVAEAVERGLSLEPLPESLREAARIRQLFPTSTTLWSGSAATEERAKSIGEEVSNLHFACHGLLDLRSPLDSGLALAAPSAPSDEDGILQAWEIFEQMRLDADLVVLSACETALGEDLPGEGVLGLVRAFHFAGARSVVATQWKVADGSAAALTSELYAQLRSGVEPAEALRRAQVRLARRPATSHPYHWAAFQMFGTAR